MEYADDAVIMGRRLKYVKEVCISLVEWINKLGFEVNKKKGHFVIVSQKPYTENEYVKTGTCNFEIMKHCTYLARILTNKNELPIQTQHMNFVLC
jgi:hypothetical protein